jgi:squalene cyclase
MSPEPRAAVSPACQSLQRGVSFLLQRQAPDGLWRDFDTLAGEAIDWPSGVIAARLHRTARPDAIAAAEHAAAELAARAQHDGGWGYHARVPTDADSTACVLDLLVEARLHGTVLDRAGRCLAAHQDPRTGGIATYRTPDPIRSFMRLGRAADLTGWCTPHLEVTATAGAVLAPLGRRHRTTAELAWSYVAARQHDDGGWSSYWWTARQYPALHAVMLAQALGHSAAIDRAADWAVATQHAEDGSWGAPGEPHSAFATALAAELLARAGHHDIPLQRAAAALAELQDRDGGWPSHPVMRIPAPHLREPDDHTAWRDDALGTGVVVRDQHRLFTTALCVSALTHATTTDC